MKVSKKLQKKRKADKRNIGIAICVIVILGALGVIIFMPSNNNNNNGTKQETQVANTNTQANNTQVVNSNTNTISTNTTNTVVNNVQSNTITNTTSVNTVNTITSNAQVTTNAKTNTTTSQTTTNNNQTTNNNNNSSEKKEESSNGWSLFNWGNNNESKEVDQDKAREIAVAEFAKLGETIDKSALTVYDLERNDGLMYYYIKSPKNTCEVRKKDGVVTRLNAKPVNQ